LQVGGQKGGGTLIKGINKKNFGGVGMRKGKEKKKEVEVREKKLDKVSKKTKPGTKQGGKGAGCP